MIKIIDESSFIENIVELWESPPTNQRVAVSTESNTDSFEEMARKGYQSTHRWRMDENGYIPGQWWDNNDGE